MSQPRLEIQIWDLCFQIGSKPEDSVKFLVIKGRGEQDSEMHREMLILEAEGSRCQGDKRIEQGESFFSDAEGEDSLGGRRRWQTRVGRVHGNLNFRGQIHFH